jgi:hypothetical protein
MTPHRTAARRRTTTPAPAGVQAQRDMPRRPGSTLPYREATELLRCIQIMGEPNTAYCRNQVLGEPMPPPAFTHESGITTPVPFGAATLRTGGRRFDIGNIGVTLLPDEHSRAPALQCRAKTGLGFHVSIGAAPTAHGHITRAPVPVVTATIHTIYGPGAAPTATSGYGRGTTAQDVAAGRTTLGFHEGTHGLDFIDAMQSNPPPVLMASPGQTVAEFRAARASYMAALSSYFANIERQSQLATDCVGTTTIDQFNATQGSITTICVPNGAVP